MAGLTVTERADLGVVLHHPPGDLVVFNSDGITESTDRRCEEFGDRQLQALLVARAARPAREIADELVISVGTAKWHVHNILQKLGVRNRSQASARARELGF